MYYVCILGEYALWNVIKSMYVLIYRGNVVKIFLLYTLIKRIMKKSCMEKTTLLKCLYFVSVGEDVLRKVPDGVL